MKVIKKYFKVVLCFMAFAVCSFLLAFAPTMSAYATLDYAISTYNVAINSIKMPTVVDVTSEVAEEREFKIPFLSSVFNAKNEADDSDKTATFYTIRVIDPAGSYHDFQVTGENASDTDSYFTKGADFVKVNALVDGTYKVVYIVNTADEEGNITSAYYSNFYSVEVKNVSYELDFSIQTGEKAGWTNLLPSKVKTDSSAKIYLPIPVAKVVGSEDAGVALDVAKGEIVVACNAKELTLGTGDFKKDEKGIYIVPSQSGKYTIQYTYKSGVNRPTKPFEILVEDDFVAPTELKVSTTPTIPNSFELGEKDINLPKLVAKNELGDNVDYNTVSIVIEKETNSNISQELKNNDHTFNMTVGANGFKNATSYEQLVGIYTITYTLEDAYGNRCVYKKRMEESSTATKNPTIYLAYDYDKADTSKVNLDANTDLKSKYGYDEIILPAAYAEDLVSEYKDLKIVRYLRNIDSSTVYYVDNLRYNATTGEIEKVQYGATGYNYALAGATRDQDKTGDVTKAIQFKFAETDEKAKTYDGTYQLEYKVIAKNIKTREQTLAETGTTRYAFTVLDYSMSDYKATTPTVEITNVENEEVLDKAKKLTVNLTAKDDDDTRLKNVVFYYYGTEKTKDEIAADIKNAIKEVQKDKDNSKHLLEQDKILTELASYTGIERATLNEKKDGYVVDFKNATGTQAVVVAVSYNDYGNVGVDTRVVTFKDTSDETAPSTTNAILNAHDLKNSDNVYNHTNKEFNLGDVVELPDVQFGGETTDAMLNVMYYVNTPETKSAGIQYKSPAGKVYIGNKIIGGKIAADKAGTYYVAYTATDDMGNTSVMYFTFTVKDTTKPLLSVSVNESEDVKISGNTITASVDKQINFSAIVRDATSNLNITDSAEIAVTIDDANGLNYSAKGMKYTFHDAGNYTLTFTASVAGKESVSKVIYVTVESEELAWSADFEVQKYASENQEVYLPYVTTKNGAQVRVKVVAPNDTKIEGLDADGYILQPSEDNGVQVWKFKTNSTKGKYKVTYVATTADETLEKTFTIRVGDNVAPTFTMNYEDELKQNIVYDGENQIEYKLDVDKSKRTFVITAESNGKQIYKYDLGLEIYDKDDTSASATKMYWSNLTYELVGDKNLEKGEKTGEYKITGVGEFTIKLKIHDDYENEAEKTITFKVVDKATATNKGDNETVGVVLIVISLVVLASVILFFLISGNKGNKSGSKTSRKVKTAKTEKVEATEEVKEDEEDAKEGEIEE